VNPGFQVIPQGRFAALESAENQLLRGTKARVSLGRWQKVGRSGCRRRAWSNASAQHVQQAPRHLVGGAQDTGVDLEQVAGLLQGHHFGGEVQFQCRVEVGAG